MIPNGAREDMFLSRSIRAHGVLEMAISQGTFSPAREAAGGGGGLGFAIPNSDLPISVAPVSQ
jgi:hypothetical protein